MVNRNCEFSILHVHDFHNNFNVRCKLPESYPGLLAQLYVYGLCVTVTMQLQVWNYDGSLPLIVQFYVYLPLSSGIIIGVSLLTSFILKQDFKSY